MAPTTRSRHLAHPALQLLLHYNLEACFSTGVLCWKEKYSKWILMADRLLKKHLGLNSNSEFTLSEPNSSLL